LLCERRCVPQGLVAAVGEIGRTQYWIGRYHHYGKPCFEDHSLMIIAMGEKPGD
jgi:hypothetical protein